ncbi:MAG TPA: hypothetical protein ENI98_10630 [Gammaproteobacteria bacterium]|nr:hypothetical protein [Gammaproteobacteria bacterium]
MSAWKTEDKAWIKARKTAWKDVKKKIDDLFQLNRDEKRSLKNYYLTGKEDPGAPLTEMDGGLLLEMWLHPDQSEAHWDKLRDKYTERDWFIARIKFDEVNCKLRTFLSEEDHSTLLTYPPDGGSIFDGLEERMYYWFRFGRLRREDWPELDDEQFLHIARRSLSLAGTFIAYFMDPFPNPFNVLRFMAQEWHDALHLFREEEVDKLDKLVYATELILKEPELFPSLHVELAKNLKEALSDSSLPGNLVNSIAAYRGYVAEPDQSLLPGDVKESLQVIHFVLDETKRVCKCE